MNTEDFNKQLKELQSKALKYDNVKGRYIEAAQKILAICEELRNVAGNLDIAVTIKKEANGMKRTRQEIQTRMEELVEALKNGTTLTSELLEKMYPNATKMQRSYLLLKLSTLKNVAKTKDGGTVKIFMKKDY